LIRQSQKTEDRSAASTAFFLLSGTAFRVLPEAALLRNPEAALPNAHVQVQAQAGLRIS
jgi:hypothetical protein